MKCSWTIVDYSSTDCNRVKEAVETSGRSCQLLALKDVYTKDLERGENSIAYGTIGSANYLSRKFGHYSWCDLPNLKCSKYYPHYYSYLMNRDGMFLPLENVIQGYRNYDIVYTLFGYQNGEDIIYIRPDANDKVFTGYVANIDDLEKLKNAVGGEELCYLAKPLTSVFNMEECEEYRFCISDNTILTGCRYLPEESTEIPEDVLDKAREIANIKYDGQPTIFVLDLIKHKNSGEVEMLELGAINTAGWYEMDHSKIVEVCSMEVENEIH